MMPEASCPQIFKLLVEALEGVEITEGAPAVAGIAKAVEAWQVLVLPTTSAESEREN